MTAIQPILSVPQLDVPPITNIRDSRLNKSLLRIIADFCLTTNNVPKLINYAIQWIGRIIKVITPGKKIHPGLESFGKAAGIYKNGFNTLRLPKTYLETKDAVSDLRKTYWKPGATRDEKAAALRKVVRKASDLCNDACDATKIINLFSPIKYMPQIDTFGSGATFFGSLNNTVDDYKSLKKAPTRDEKILSGLALAISISYSFVGLFGLCVAVKGSVLVSSLVLVPLTIAVICATISYFFSNLRDPKGENRDPAKVLNVLKGRLHPLPAAA